MGKKEEKKKKSLTTIFGNFLDCPLSALREKIP